MIESKSEKLLVIKPSFGAWPVGFAYVLACLEENKIPFDFIDSSISNNWKNDINFMLANNSYFAVATGGLIGFFSFFQEVAYIMRKHRPDIPLILGGNVTKDAGNSLLFDTIGMDFGILGEVETSLPRLIHSILNKDDSSADWPGIMYKDAEGNVVRNAPQRFNLKDANILPAWHNFDVSFYIKNGSLPFIGSDMCFMPVLTGRGCVGKCTFCSPSIGGFRKRPIEHVLFEIEYLASKYNFDNIMFYNEMFYPTAREIREFCDKYSQLKSKKPWIVQVRVDSNLDVVTFRQMKEAGCIVVSAGIESGSDNILRLMNKKTTSDQIRRFYRNAKLADMPANGTYIVGNEGETEEDLKKTIDLVIDEEINTGESLMYVYPGTVAYDHALKKGLIKNEMLHLIKTAGNTTTLFSPNVKEEHINISEMPDDHFLDTATSEVRRYNTFVFNRYTVQDLSLKIEIQGKNALMTMAGKCQECGADVSNNYYSFIRSGYVGLLGQGVHDRYICQKCYKQLSFNVYTSAETKGLSAQFSLLKDKLSKKNRIILGGINNDALFILRINLFDMDYGKIAGFVDFTRLYRGKYYINYPVFNIEDIVDLAPDCVLMLDSLSDGENIIRDIYTKKQIPPPEILYLFDNQLLDALKKIAVLLTQTDRAEDDLTHELKEINALIQAENPAEALRKLESLATKYPGNASIVSALGAIYHKQNNKDKALSCYRRTVDLEPDNINYLKKLASYYVEDGNVENALGLYTKTLSLKPDDVETLLAIGQVCINIGQIEDGKIFFDAVIAYDPQNPHARLALNWTLGKMLMEKNEAGKIVNALLSNKTISEVVIVYDLLNSPPNYGVVIYMAMFAKYFLAKGFKITFIIINSEYRDDWAVFSDAKKLNLVESFLELPRVLLENKEMVEIHLMSWSEFSAYFEKNHTAFIPFEDRIKKREYYYPYVFNVINQLVSVEDATFIDDFLMSYKDIISKCPVSIPQTPYVTWQARYSDKWAINRNCSEAEFIKIYESLKILYPGHLIMLVSDQMGCDYFKSLSSNYNLPLLFSKDFAATFMGDVALILGSDYYFQLRGGGIGAAVIYSKVPYGMILNIRDEGHETEWTKGRLSPWATNKQLFINGNVGFPHDVIV